jgi:hypothetical protein
VSWYDEPELPDVGYLDRCGAYSLQKSVPVHDRVEFGPPVMFHLSLYDRPSRTWAQVSHDETVVVAESESEVAGADGGKRIKVVVVVPSTSGQCESSGCGRSP